MSKGHILVAEDDPTLRTLYEKKLGAAGFIVRTADDGEPAIQLIKGEPPDLVLLDENMPKVDGFAVLQAFPKHARNFPIIMLTNASDEQSRLRAEELGADGYYVKHDSTLASLVDMVEKMGRFHDA